MHILEFFRLFFPAPVVTPEPAPKHARKPRAKKPTVKKSLPVAKKKRSAK